MPELERELRELGRSVAFPATPDVAGAVRRRLATEASPRRPFLGGRRALVLAFAVLAVAAGAAMAVPQARTAILEWLGLRGVTIERAETTPTAPERDLGLAALELGAPVTLAEAAERAEYDLLVPPAGLGPPDAILFDDAAPGGQVSFVYREGDRVRLLLSEFRAFVGEEVIRKAAGPGTTIERVDVGEGPAWWLAGEPHSFVYVDPELGQPREETLRLAGNTLLWQDGQRTLRLEGDGLTKRDALRIARSLRPA